MKDKLNQCVSILSQFQIGFSQALNERNEIVLANNEKCMNEYYQQFPEMSQNDKQTKDDFDPKFSSHFSGMSCRNNSYGSVEFNGKFTNGEYPYATIWFTTALLDSQGNVVDTGLAEVSNIAPYETKIWSSSFYPETSWSECIIEIDSVIER